MTQTAQHQWVLAPSGEIDFAEISDSIAKTINRQAGKIRLERGNWQYGLFHIEQRHGAQILALGFESVVAFVYESLKTFDQIWQPNQTTQLVAVMTSQRPQRQRQGGYREAQDGALELLHGGKPLAIRVFKGLARASTRTVDNKTLNAHVDLFVSQHPSR